LRSPRAGGARYGERARIEHGGADQRVDEDDLVTESSPVMIEQPEADCFIEGREGIIEPGHGAGVNDRGSLAEYRRGCEQ